MRLVFLNIFLGACLSAHAAPLELKSTVVLTGQTAKLRRDLDPGWLSGMPAKQYTGASVIDGKWEGLTFRYRLDYDQARGGEDLSAFNTERSGGHLLQLRKNFFFQIAGR